MRSEVMPDSANTTNWRELYEAALLEHDPARLKPLIAHAHRAIQKEIRRLWYAGMANSEERRSLDIASRYLEVLYSCTDQRHQKRKRA